MVKLWGFKAEITAAARCGERITTLMGSTEKHIRVLSILAFWTEMRQFSCHISFPLKGVPTAIFCFWFLCLFWFGLVLFGLFFVLFPQKVAAKLT